MQKNSASTSLITNLRGHLRSFQDSDADGVGDLVGIESRLDYFAELGNDVIWLLPIDLPQWRI